MQILILLGLTFFSILPGISDNTRIVFFPDRAEHYHRSISLTMDPDSQIIFILENENGRLSRLLPSGDHEVLDTLNFEESDDYHFMEFSVKDGSLYFWEAGLGEVYRYDLLPGKLNHISKTKIDGLMYAHGGFLNENGSIYVQGGYGFWEMRELLLTFDPELQEWLLESDAFPDQHTLSEPNVLWFDRVNNKINLFSRPEEDHYLLTSYDPEIKEWEVRKRYKADSQISFIKEIWIRNSYTTDPENRLTNLYSGVLIHNDNSSLYHLEYDEKRLSIFGMFFVPDNKEWIIFGRNREISEMNISFWRIPAQDLPLKKVDLDVLLIAGITNEEAVAGLLMISLVAALAFVFLSGRKVSMISTVTKKAVIYIEDDTPIIRYQNHEIPVTDELMQRTWLLIARMKRSGKSVMTLSDFDEYIFRGEHSDSFYTKKRKQIFQEVNVLVNAELLTTATNAFDKRARDVRFGLDLIELGVP